ncbi:hypothetical protein BaRGS_00019417 [Batillaria attramentaria]|uniref:Uncharacterized protein n=1 Tax=Batillaria attramentaria TaxID=370345 RepID=A0ABD0KQH0_9CAEN
MTNAMKAIKENHDYLDVLTRSLAQIRSNMEEMEVEIASFIPVIQRKTVLLVRVERDQEAYRHTLTNPTRTVTRLGPRARPTRSSRGHRDDAETETPRLSRY